MSKVQYVSASFAIFIVSMLPLPVLSGSINYVIHISIDGLRSDGVTALDSATAPNFYRLRTEGAFTDNARTDVEHTDTLPNHTSQLTGRGVDGPSGHNYTENSIPATGTTLKTNKGSYISSVFDVVHDNGSSTGLYASKEKFILFDQSYDATAGEPDGIGPDNGTDKIDRYDYNDNVDPTTSNTLVDSYLMAMSSAPFNYTLLHLRNPDSAGHDSTWDLTADSDYLGSIVDVDSFLGDIFMEIDDASSPLNGHTAIILTADHGGRLSTKTHGPEDDAENYTIPFYVWGPGVAAGADLYTLNPSSRADPGTAQPAYGDPNQPIRNGDGANLALGLLGLGPVPGSTINAAQDLNVTPIPLPTALPMVPGVLLGMGF